MLQLINHSARCSQLSEREQCVVRNGSVGFKYESSIRVETLVF